MVKRTGEFVTSSTPTPAGAFEKVLKLLAASGDSTQTIPDRNAVVGGGTTNPNTSTASNTDSGSTSGGGSDSSSSTGRWLADGGMWWHVSGIGSQLGHGGLALNHDHNWSDSAMHNGVGFQVVVGVNNNNQFLNSPTGPWQMFANNPVNILKSFSAAPWQTNQFSPRSMVYAAEVLAGVGSTLDTWAQNFNTWANDVDTSDSDWQGSAAGVFKNTLEQYTSTLRAVSSQLASLKIANALINADSVMTTNVANFAAAADNWLNNKGNNPNWIVDYLFNWALSNNTTTWRNTAKGYTPTVMTPFGDTWGQGFIDNLEDAAKQSWLASLAPLDAAATTFLANVDAAYSSLSIVIPQSFLPPVLLNPPIADPTASSGGIGGDGGASPFTIPPFNLDSGNAPGNPNGLPSDFTTTNGGGPGAVPPDLPPFTTSGGGSSSGPSDFTTSGGGSNFAPSDFTTSGGGSDFGPSDFTTSGGGSDVITGPDGQPVLGPDGQPFTVPGGSTISSDGTVLGPNGQPLTGPNGQPLTVPPGSSLSSGDTVTDSNGQTVFGPDGQPLTVPSGSTISSDGTVLGPNGQPVMGPNGQPLTVPGGSTIVPNSSGGPSVPQDFTTTSGGGPSTTLPNFSTASGGGPSAELPNFTTTSGSGSAGITVGRDGLSLPSLGAPAGGSAGSVSFGGTGGLGAGRLFGSGGGAFGPSDVPGGGVEGGAPAGEPLPGGEHTADTADLGMAAEESEALGRVATVGGAAGAGAEPPMMPPMGGGMGGGGPATSGGKKTWVTESEDTWGTAASAGTGVLGR
jgi:hypothetical protein